MRALGQTRAASPGTVPPGSIARSPGQHRRSLAGIAGASPGGSSQLRPGAGCEDWGALGVFGGSPSSPSWAGWRSVCFQSSKDHLDQLNSNAGAPLSRGTEKTEQHCWGSPRPAGLRMQREAELPLQTPAPHASKPLHLATALLGYSPAARAPSSCPGTASDTRCLPRSPPHPADTGHAGPCATSSLLIIGKAGVRPADGLRDMPQGAGGTWGGIAAATAVAMPWRSLRLHRLSPWGCVGG